MGFHLLLQPEPQVELWFTDGASELGVYLSAHPSPVLIVPAVVPGDENLYVSMARSDCQKPLIPLVLELFVPGDTKRGI